MILPFGLARSKRWRKVIQDSAIKRNGVGSNSIKFAAGPQEYWLATGVVDERALCAILWSIDKKH
jgi:hypothetical protein